MVNTMRDEVLELETRRDIYEFIMKYPGLHMREIHRQLDMPIALAEYHLNYLEKADIIQSMEEDGYKRYYVRSVSGKDTGPEIGYPERKILGVLRQGIPLQITLFLLDNGQVTHTKIASHLKISPSKLSYHLKKLLKLNVIRKLDRADGKGYVIENERYILRLLTAHKPSQDMLDEFSDLWESLDLL